MVSANSPKPDIEAAGHGPTHSHIIGEEMQKRVLPRCEILTSVSPECRADASMSRIREWRARQDAAVVPSFRNLALEAVCKFADIMEREREEQPLAGGLLGKARGMRQSLEELRPRIDKGGARRSDVEAVIREGMPSLPRSFSRTSLSPIGVDKARHCHVWELARGALPYSKLRAPLTRQ